MTGRELIIYILQNNLEDKPVFVNGKFVGFLSVGETAQRLGCGIETVKTMISLGMIDDVVDGDLIPEVSVVKLKEKE